MTTNDGTPTRATIEPCPKPITRTNGDAGQHRQQPVDLVPAAGPLELGNCDGADPGHVADREIDLPEQEDEDDAEGEHRRPGHLDEDVGEVDRGEEVRRLEAEEGDDEDEAEDERAGRRGSPT